MSSIVAPESLLQLVWLMVTCWLMMFDVIGSVITGGVDVLVIVAFAEAEMMLDSQHRQYSAITYNSWQQQQNTMAWPGSIDL
jgi:hypothetical protein